MHTSKFSVSLLLVCTRFSTTLGALHTPFSTFPYCTPSKPLHNRRFSTSALPLQEQNPTIVYSNLKTNSFTISKMTANNTLPLWNLTSHFGWESWKDPRILTEILELENMAAKFCDKYKGHVKDMLESSIKDFEALTEIEIRVSTYLHLTYDTDQHNSELNKFKTSLDARLSKMNADYLTFYNIEMASLSDDDVSAQMTPSLKFYESFIRDQRRQQPHILSHDVERALKIRQPWASSSPVVDYYQKQLAMSQFNFKGDSLNLEKLLSKFHSTDSEVRSEALKTLNSGLESQYLNRFASLSLNVVAGSWHIETAERQFRDLRSQRNFANDIPDDVVRSLLTAVRTKGVALAKRYYLLKKRILLKTQNLQNFTWADRNAPLALKAGEKLYTWTEAVDICAKGYKTFSSKMHELFMQQINEQRLHVPPLDGKQSGAYCSGCIPGIGPFQMHNFMGTPNDVATLAHESGHGAHFLLSYEQGVLQYHPPLTLAETASIFGEMIVFRDLLNVCTSSEEKLAMLLEKIDSIVNSVVRQCSFDRFEELFHSARQNGIVSEDDFDRFWMQATEEYYGKEGEIFDSYEHMDKLWVYVSHFHAVPFYVYSYAFADLVVGALYSTYQKNSENFETNLLNLLRAGGTKTFIEVLKPFGLHPEDPQFWADSLSVQLESFIEQAEKLADELETTVLIV